VVRFSGLVAAAAVLTLGVSIVGLLGRWHWAIDLMGHQRRFYAMALLVAVAWLLIRKRWAWAGVAGVGLAVNAWLLGPMYLGGQASPAEGAGRLRVVTFNVNTDNARHAEVAGWLATTDADVIAVLETDRAWVDALREVAGYELAIAKPRGDNFGLALMERREPRDGVRLLRAESFVEPDDKYGVRSLEAVVRLDGRDLALLVTHPPPPIGSVNAADHATKMAWLGELVAKRRADAALAGVVVTGDLNATPFSHAWPALADAGLVNSQRGHGWQATWPDRLVPIGLGIPIDHLLHTPSLTTLDRRVGPSLGSDHHAIVVDLAWSATPD